MILTGPTPPIYLDQVLTTVLAGAPEVFLFHYGALISAEFRGQAEAFAAHREEFESLARFVGNWGGIPAYKPPSSDPGHEPFIFDQIGMLGIPLLPTARFPESARAALFTSHALEDTEFVSKLAPFLKAGGTALLTEELAHRLNADPRLSVEASLNLAKGQYVKSLEAGGGKLVVFSDALPRLTHIDAQNRVAQLTSELRPALAELRKIISEFTATSPDAPPRVAMFPLGGRVAVVNYTELPVACRLTGLMGMARKYVRVFSTSGAFLASDGATLRLPPHAVLVVE